MCKAGRVDLQVGCKKGVPKTQSHRRRISETMKGKKKSLETRLHMRKSMSVETRLKISRTRQNMEDIRKLDQFSQGKPLSYVVAAEINGRLKKLGRIP
ncbi:hypothetical protein MUP77_03105 [Candidatus Bathyarchaeota archaeon]|nr:hypothetical protein [Candidatus Bathyarchaeota archaeon]